MDPSRAGARVGFGAVLVLTVLALVARLMETGAGLPHLAEPDNAYFSQPRLIADGGSAAREHHDYNKYPQLVARLLMLLPAPRLVDDSLDEHLNQAASPSLRPRVLIAISGAACVPATFLLARQFLSVGWALFSAALLSTSLLHQLFSAQGRPHVPVTLFITLTIWASLRLLRRANWGDYLLAGAFAALALGCLHNGIAALLPLGAAHFLRARGRGAREQLKFVAPLLMVAASAAAFLPFLFLAPTGESTGALIESSGLKFGAHMFHFDEVHGRGFAVIAWTLWSYEPILVGLLCLALLLFARRVVRLRGLGLESWPRVIVVASFAVPYLLAIGIYDSCYERFVIPLLPCLVVLAAWGVKTLSECTPVPTLRRTLGVGLAICLLAWPAWASIRLTRLCAAPDTATLAARWLSEHVDPRTERLLVSWQLDLPLARAPSEAPLLPPVDLRLSTWIFPWTSHQLGLAPNSIQGPVWKMAWLPYLDPTFMETFKESGVQALAKLDWTLMVEGSFSDGWSPGNQQRLHAAIDEMGEQIASFVPQDDEGIPRALWWQESGRVALPFWRRLQSAQSFGPVIEIYRRR